jgi:hypothetical protein
MKAALTTVWKCRINQLYLSEYTDLPNLSPESKKLLQELGVKKSEINADSDQNKNDI